MKKYGIVSYNIYCNFTNYGSALQSWALHQIINKIGNGKWTSVLIDYCPDILSDKDPLNPFKNMWDKDEESLRMCKLSMPAIQINYEKFNAFYQNCFLKTKKKYTSDNFNEVIKDEELDGFVCGSDTIFCIDEFGFDDGYYANYECMKNGYTISYAASFGDSHFDDSKYEILNEKLQNFKALGIRENEMIPYVREHVTVPLQRVIDPTLLLTAQDYDALATKRLVKEKYLLLYARRYDQKMFDYAEKFAAKNGWKVVDISLRATNKDRHIMYYTAGVEEFLSLVKNAEYVITNSYHGMIFSVQYGKPFYIFSREQCDTKIKEVLELFGIHDRMRITGEETDAEEIDYNLVYQRISDAREKSLLFLKTNLDR